MSKAGQFRDESSIQAESFWDSMRAASMTPDRETFQNPDPLKGGFLGLGQKVAAQIGSIPASFVDLVKAVPQLAPLIGGAMNPQGAMERIQLGSMGTDMLKNAVENPATTAAGMLAPGGAYGLAREGVYATLGANAPHAMMWLRSMLPWYEGKPWTRVPEGVAKIAREGIQSGSELHAESPENMVNVANRLNPYLKSIGESSVNKDPAVLEQEINAFEKADAAFYTNPELYNSNMPPPQAPSPTRMPYIVPKGLEEVVGGAFVQETPGRTRILDDLRWYLDAGKAEIPGVRGTGVPVPFSSMNPPSAERLKELFATFQKAPQLALQVARDLLGKGSMTGAMIEKSSETNPVYLGAVPSTPHLGRSNLRDLLEVMAKRHGHAYPIDWNIDVPMKPEFAAAAATNAARDQFESAAQRASEYVKRNYPTGTARTGVEDWWSDMHHYAAIGRTRQTIQNARKVVEDAGSRIAKKPHQGLPPGVD